MIVQDHLPILPIVLPLAAGAFALIVDEGRQGLRAAIAIGACVALVAIGIALVGLAGASAVTVYSVGDWAAPFGIVLVVDRISAVLVLLASLLGASSLVFSLARWHRTGPRFHSLVLFLLVGVNGSFLTGDLFNLFVFFEVLLAASYGLALHGSGPLRVTAGLHYITVNLAASLLFLIGVSLIYSSTGTLNMADLGRHWREAATGDRVLFEIGGGILGIAFLVKAGMWPLCFWLPGAYGASSAPVGALFAVLSKVGVYAVLRTGALFLGADVAAAPSAGTPWLVVAGGATLAFGALGVLASQNLARLASYCVLVSSGTLLAAIAIDNTALTGAALYYLVVSTLALSAFFLLVDLVERGRRPGSDVLAVTAEAFNAGEQDDEDEEVGALIPAATALLGVSFAGCAIMLAGLPPLSGFVGKVAMLDALLEPDPVPMTSWIMLALLLGSGLATIIAMARAGIRRFWTPPEVATQVRVVEIAPIALLLLVCVALTINAGDALRYLDGAARALHAPGQYVDQVLGR